MRSSTSTLGLELEHARHHLQPVGGLADDLEIGLAGEQGLEPIDDDLVIVGEQDASLHPLSHRTLRADGKGSSAVSRVRAPSDSMVQLPPSAAARSRMPRSPLESAARAPSARRSPCRRRRSAPTAIDPARHTRTVTRRHRGVARDVGERLLHDAKRGGLDVGGQRPSSPSCANSTFDARSARCSARRARRARAEGRDRRASPGADRATSSTRASSARRRAPRACTTCSAARRTSRRSLSAVSDWPISSCSSRAMCRRSASSRSTAASRMRSPSVRSSER